MILVDTSIWGRLACKSDMLHDVAKNALQQFIQSATPPAIAAQSIYEFWVVATRPKANNGLEWAPERAANWTIAMRRTCTLLVENDRTLPQWEKLVISHATRGKSAHDARLVAVMQIHNIRSILTFNVADFIRYPINVVDPRTL